MMTTFAYHNGAKHRHLSRMSCHVLDNTCILNNHVYLDTSWTYLYLLKIIICLDII